MTTLSEIVRRERERLGWSQSELARRVGVSPQSIQQLESGNVVRPRYIHALSRVFGVDLLVYTPNGHILSSVHTNGDAQADVDVTAAQPSGAGRRDLPVYASAALSTDYMVMQVTPTEWVERPEPLIGVKDAFAVYVVTNAMEPRLQHGDMALIHPTKPARPGDSVLVVLTRAGENGTGNQATIKELVRRAHDTLVVRQLNPEEESEIPLSEVRGVHKVVGAYFG